MGAQPWPEEGVPLIPGAVATLACTVEAIHPTRGGSKLVVCRVDELALGDGDRPLLYWQCTYRRLEQE